MILLLLRYQLIDAEEGTFTNCVNFAGKATGQAADAAGGGGEKQPTQQQKLRGFRVVVEGDALSGSEVRTAPPTHHHRRRSSLTTARLSFLSFLSFRPDTCLCVRLTAKGRSLWCV